MVFCRNTILGAKELLNLLIQQNDEIRLSIDLILIDIARPLLKTLDIAFKPGLSRIQWLSSDLKMYTTNVTEVCFCLSIN